MTQHASLAERRSAARGFRALAGLVAVAGLVAACGQPGAAGTAAATGAAGKAGAGPQEVVIYTSVDQQFAEPVLQQFEKDTGITVKPIFDVEAAKTTGLVNRLVAEADRPQADVWWSSEFAQTVELADQGLLTPYASPSAADLPAASKDPGDLWSAFGGRARIILVNTDRLKPEAYPKGLADFAHPAVPANEVGIALPVFGTTANQAAALYAQDGPAAARSFFEDLEKAGVRVLDGNGAVRDLVANGTLAYGLTDTDDACGAVTRGEPVAVVVPDQEPGGRGTLVVPNTVGLVKDGPHAEAGQKLVDYLLSPETEARLVAADWIQVPSRPGVAKGSCGLPETVRRMDVPLPAIAAQIARVKTELAEVFVR